MHWEYGLAMAFKYFSNNVSEMAKQTGISEDRLDYLCNKNAKQMRLDEAIIIDVATQSAVFWYQLMDQVDPRVKQRLDKGSSMSTAAYPSHMAEKPLSERVFEVMMLEKEKYGNRQGQRTDIHFVPNYDEVTGNANKTCLFKGRTDAQVARDIGLNRTQYRDAKKVLLEGSFELIKAMDTWLKPYRAVRLTRYSLDKQRWILSLTRQEIMVYTNGESSIVQKSTVDVI